MRRLERNLAVLSQTMLWAAVLQRGSDLFSEDYPFLRFGELQTFDLDAGIDDRAWLGGEEQAVADGALSSLEDRRLFDL